MDFKNEIALIIADSLSADANEILAQIETPPNSEMGDYAFPCFKLAKTFRKAPPAIAADIGSGIKKPDFISEIKIEAAYVNFFIDKKVYAENALKKVLSEKENYGESTIGNGKTVVIDYSSPNTAKPFHVGHLRTTVIGHALYNIYKALGYNTVSVNHLGDWGTQFGKLIVAYKLWGDRQAVDENGIMELNRVYIKFHEEAEKDKDLNEQARIWLVKLQKGDDEARDLWKWFNEISMKDLKRIYSLFGIEFDYYTPESFYNDKIPEAVELLKEKNLLKESDGAMVVDLEEYKMPPCLILKRDGGTLYPTTDIAAAIYRSRTFNFHKCLYLTGYEQKLHFEQWMKVIELMGFDFAKKLEHLPLGLISFEEGKLSTRKGNVILMEDLLNESIAKTREIIEVKNPELENKEEVSKQVGIGAIVFNDLYNNRIKEVIFSYDRILSFEGESGPYLQYTHARACSILSKLSDSDDFSDVDYSLLIDEASNDVIKNIALYPDRIIEASMRNEPYIVGRHLMEMAKSFSKFYNTNYIKDSAKEVMRARLCLVYSFKTVLCSGLKLLGMAAPEKM